MLADAIRIVSYESACILLFAVLVFRILSNRYANGLNTVPGPTTASLSDLWRFFKAWGRRTEVLHIALHEQYGPVVRIGPKAVSISDPKAVQIVHALNAGFTKSDF